MVLHGLYTVLRWLAFFPCSALLVSYLAPFSTPTRAVPGHNAGFSLYMIIMVVMIVSQKTYDSLCFCLKFLHFTNNTN